ncbi:hypothetical protein HK104_004380 [Borealophlyctis nickersoniae]|nr:hypothetical protein HK104_004380 [Borealophlyctis nickersoniae]
MYHSYNSSGITNVPSQVWEYCDDDDSDLQPPAVLDLLVCKRTELVSQYGKAYDDFLNTSDKEKKNVAFETMENVASKYLFWGILTLDEVREIAGPDGENEIRDFVKKTLELCQFDTSLEKRTHLSVEALLELSPREIYLLGKKAKHDGINGAMQLVTEWDARGSGQGVGLRPSTSKMMSKLLGEPKKARVPFTATEEDKENEDIAYLIDIVRTGYKAIEDNISSLSTLERQADVVYMSRIFRVYLGVFDRHLYAQPVTTLAAHIILLTNELVFIVGNPFPEPHG